MIFFGSGLNLLIETPCTTAGDWMAFALCYSIRRILPEAKFSVKLDKRKDRQIYNWVGKLQPKKSDGPFNLVLHPCMVLLRPISRIMSVDDLCSEAKEDKFTPFVSYRTGCGKFVTSEWIDKEGCPFPKADHFVSEGMNSNEAQILKLWKQADVLYPLLARS